MNPMPAVPRKFNIAGPCDLERHYMLPPLDRLPEVRPLVDECAYFVIRAARQSGKTTFLKAMTEAVNAEGRFYALYCSLEALDKITDDEKAMARAVGILRSACQASGMEALRVFTPDVDLGNPSTAVMDALVALCRSLDKPLVLFVDEADCLSGLSATTFLRQVRSGYVSRSPAAPFPWSLALVGMRDISDYKAQARAEGETLGSASPFNIVTKTMTLANFTPAEIALLYRQHTEETGQAFEDGAMERAFWWTEGQPWLVNAIARQIIVEDLGNDHSRTITAAHVDSAADVIGKRRDTHIESLLSKLKWPRVRRVIEPVLTGGKREASILDDDTKFCLDLGLVVPERINNSGNPEGLRPANPIYSGVMVRVLSYSAQMSLPRELENRWMDGERIDMTGLLREFQRFWRESSKIWVERFEYKEAAPQLLLYAFLQRVVNGGAHTDYEYALGRGRVDICVRYGQRKYPIELKVSDAGTAKRAKTDGLAQMARYMDESGAKEGWLVIFDRDPGKSWDEKITWTAESLPDGGMVQVVGC
jgi:hypothetical protein